MLLEFGCIHVFQALVNCKILPNKIFIANLALNHNFWTVLFDMLEKLLSGHMLEVLMITNITTEFRAVIDSMLLKVTHCLPNDFTMLRISVTLMRELTEINAVNKHFIDILQEISSSLAVRTANIKTWSGLTSLSLGTDPKIVLPSLLRVHGY